ncbi:MAG TPA: ABC transporter permease [Vicinamibacterales bacterium]|nr:ABC transporter permease [Vicinamibacterales bacterium]
MTGAGARVFAALLRAFPRSFRDAYGPDMAAAFDDRRRAARRTGRLAVAALWLRTAINLTAAGIAERRRSSLTIDSIALPSAHRGHLMNGWLQDIRYALRRLRREPGYALFVIATLTLGIGANVAVFSIVDSVLLHALPYDRSDRLVGIWGRFLPESGFDFPQFVLSNPEYLDYQRDNRSVEKVGALQQTNMTIGGAGEEPERIRGAVVTPSLFDVLRATPARGRLFTADDRPGPNGVVILSDGLWRRRFGGRDDVVGAQITVNGSARTVVGVMPKSFDYPEGNTIWTPLYIDPANPGGRSSHSTRAIGRLKDGVTLETAANEMAVMMQGWRQQYPTVHNGHFLYLSSMLEDTVGDVRPVLRLLLAATAFLLLIVCANVASLVLARAERRAREVAIRAALGSGRWRLVRLAALESGMLAIAAGALGAVLAALVISWVRTADGVSLPRAAEIGVGWRVWAFTAAVSLLAACLLGVLPALRSRATRLASALRLDTRTSTGAGRTWARRSLVALEVALAVVLVVGASLMVQSFTRLIASDAGFKTDGTLLATINLPRPAYADDGKADAFFDQAIDQLSRLPGVTIATATTTVPLVNGVGVWDFAIEGRPRPGLGQPAWNAPPSFVRAGFFEALRTPILRGRAFTAADRAGAESVAIISQRFAQKFFAEEDPIGRRIRVDGDKNQFARIVGISADVKDQDLGEDARPMYYMPQPQTAQTINSAMRQMTFVLRTDGDPAALGAPLRAALKTIDPALAVYGIRTYDDAVGSSVAQRRVTAALLALFAVFGLALGVVGVYGVLAYTVAEQTQELGIRRALGAPGVSLVRLVLTQGLVPALAGIVAGVGAALSASSLLRSQLFGISPTDATTYAAVVGVVLAAAVVACLLPTRRALRVSPLTALRGL